MKKLCTLLLTLICVLSASALPEELYLVGNFNGWSTPDMDQNLFILSPTDTEGTYSGTFDIPAQTSGLQFKVFTAKSGDWDYAYGVSDFSDPEMYLFSDLNCTIMLMKANNTPNAHVVNWKGGKITVTCALDEPNNNMFLTLTGPDQPATPPAPENIWIIGDFNDWAVPSASSDNGAIKMAKQDDFLNNPGYYAPNAAIPSGKAKFIYYYIDPADNKAKFVEGGEYTQATGMYRSSEFSQNALLSGRFRYTTSPFIHDNLNDARAKATNIINYTGPDLSVYIGWELPLAKPKSYNISWEDAPVNDVNNLYLYIENIDSKATVLFAPDLENDSYSIWKKLLSGNIRIWLTESQNLPIDNKWGAYSDTDIEMQWGYTQNYCITDGKPITLNLGRSHGDAYISFNKGTHQITVESYKAGYYDAEKLYVIGYMSDWRAPIEENASMFQTLEKVSEGEYEGTVNFPSTSNMSFTDPQFRLHYKLDDWNNPGSIGVSYDEQNPVNIEFTNSQYSSPIITNAKGNWRLPEWTTDGDVKIHVDFNTNTMTLTNFSTNSVKGIESEEMNAPVVYFNLQGQRVINPSNGIFIRVQGAKSEKVILK